MAKCKEQVMHGYRLVGCSRNAWRDGYCKQHHPETIKAREEESRNRWDAKVKVSPAYLLTRAQEQIGTLEAELSRLREDRDAWRQSEAACNEQYNKLAAETQQLREESERLRRIMGDVAEQLNRTRANIEGVLWPNSGMATPNKPRQAGDKEE